LRQFGHAATHHANRISTSEPEKPFNWLLSNTHAPGDPKAEERRRTFRPTGGFAFVQDSEGMAEKPRLRMAHVLLQCVPIQ
jgi:hypothetical protein